MRMYFDSDSVKDENKFLFTHMKMKNKDGFLGLDVVFSQFGLVRLRSQPLLS